MKISKISLALLACIVWLIASFGLTTYAVITPSLEKSTADSILVMLVASWFSTLAFLIVKMYK
jgi:hypothetical protein